MTAALADAVALQAGDLTAVQTAVLVFAGASALLGLFIAGLATRAVLRNRSRQMLFLALGMVLLFGVAYGVSLLGSIAIELEYLAMGSQDPFWLAVRVTQFAGLSCIAYSLWIGRTSAPGR